MISATSISVIVYLVLLAGLVWLIWRSRKSIDRYHLYWPLLVLLLSGLLTIRSKLENWPVGPGVVIISGWCLLRLASIYVLKEKPRGRDWAPIMMLASGGLALVLFFAVGYGHEAALSGHVFLAAQVTGAVIYALLAELLSRRIGANFRDIGFGKLPPHRRSWLGMLFAIVVVTVILGLLAYTLDLLGADYDSHPDTLRYPLFAANKLVVFVWLNSSSGMFLYNVVRSLYLKVRVPVAADMNTLKKRQRK